MRKGLGFSPAAQNDGDGGIVVFVPAVSPQVSQLIEAVLQHTQDFLDAAEGPGDPAATANLREDCPRYDERR